jgi:hypothetical protein
MVTDLSKPLWSDQSVDEVDHQSRGHETGKRVIENHEASSEPVAGVGVTDRQNEKNEAERKKNGVEHDRSLWCCGNNVRPMPGVIKMRYETVLPGIKTK